MRSRNLLASALACALGASAHAQCPSSCTTTIPGPIWTGTATTAGSPYCVTGDVLIGDLLVEPGVCIFVEEGVEFDVAVRARVMGTAAQPVTITSKDPAKWWDGFKFTGIGPGSEFNHCTISRSDSSAIGIFTGAAPILRHCTITGNTQTGNGGGIEAIVDNGDFILENCTISENTSTGHAGGIRADMQNGTTLRMTDCKVSHNIANPNNAGGDYFGGGLHLTGSATITDCTFDGNEVWGSCGGVFCGSSSRGSSIHVNGSGFTTITRSEFMNGRAHTTYGPSGGGWSRGALFLDGGTVELKNCIVSCNTVTGSAPSTSGVWVQSGTVNITNCVIARNTVSSGLTRQGGTVLARNSIIYFNNGPTGNPPVYGAQTSGTITFEHCDVQGTIMPGPGNISVNPAFMGTGCDTLDFCIFPFSPVVDMGDPAILDARRPPGHATDRSDMGAFGGAGNEWDWNKLCYADCEQDCDLDPFDFLCFQQAFVSQDPYADCEHDGDWDIFDYLCFQGRFADGC